MNCCVAWLAEINHEYKLYNSHLCPPAGAILRDHAAPPRKTRRRPEDVKSQKRARGIDQKAGDDRGRRFRAPLGQDAKVGDSDIID